MSIPKALLARREVRPLVMRLRRQYTRRSWNGEVHEAILKIGCQYFTFATADTLTEVQWYRDQMANALSVMLSQNNTGKEKDRMKHEDVEMIADAIMRLVHGPTHGASCEPGGMEAITLALAGGFHGTKDDSVASGLHDIADAIRELAEAIRP